MVVTEACETVGVRLCSGCIWKLTRAHANQAEAGFQPTVMDAAAFIKKNDFTPVRVHDLRHSNGTLMDMAGVGEEADRRAAAAIDAAFGQHPVNTAPVEGERPRLRLVKQAEKDLQMAERGGFEPPRGLGPLLVFETSPFNRSGTSP